MRIFICSGISTVPDVEQDFRSSSNISANNILCRGIPVKFFSSLTLRCLEESSEAHLAKFSR
jgi:hypothetical protein